MCPGTHRITVSARKALPLPLSLRTKPKLPDPLNSAQMPLCASVLWYVLWTPLPVNSPYSLRPSSNTAIPSEVRGASDIPRDRSSPVLSPGSKGRELGHPSSDCPTSQPGTQQTAAGRKFLQGAIVLENERRPKLGFLLDSRKRQTQGERTLFGAHS